MKWSLVSEDKAQEKYELWDEETNSLLLFCQPGLGTIRIGNEIEKRFLPVERKGFSKNKTILKNEYGIRILQLLHESSDWERGIIEFDETRLHYKIQKHLFTELVITTPTGEILVTCELPKLTGKTFSDYDYLILSICWHLFIATENKWLAYA